MMLRQWFKFRHVSTVSKDHSLLQRNAPYVLPKFNELKNVNDFTPLLTTLLKEYETGLATIILSVKDEKGSTWALQKALEENAAPLENGWQVLGHLMSVQNSSALRTIHASLQPAVVQAFTKQAQSKTLYTAFKNIKDGSTFTSLQPAQQRIIEATLLSAELKGVACTEQERFNTLLLQSAELSTKFSNNVLDATNAFSLLITDKKLLDGLPPYALQLAASNAGAEDVEKGPWKLTLDGPCLTPVLTYCHDATVRKTLYEAYISRCSTANDADVSSNNEEIMKTLVNVRDEMATLLNFSSYAEMSVASKMAPSVNAIQEMLIDLSQKCKATAQEEQEELQEYATQHASQNKENDLLQHWDIAYWSEKRRGELFHFSEAELKPYFPLESVLSGLFTLCGELFSVSFKQAEAGSVQVWHKDVRYYSVTCTRSGEEIASFYLDPFSRPSEKNGGAWFNVCLSKTAKSLPVAYLVCNSSPPTADQDALLTFREVETLFHEFGHGLQHMLTTVKYPAAAGISGVEWDAVELPSQFMEYFCYRKETLNNISCHVNTGESLPTVLQDKLIAARKYRAASTMLRQVYFSLLDLQVHHQKDASLDLLKVQHDMARQYSILPPHPKDRFLCAFSHIFAGGYSAGYYSYKWAELLACDAYEVVEETSVPEAGARFRDTVLSLGGSVHPSTVFTTFRGRDMTPEALLRRYGLCK